MALLDSLSETQSFSELMSRLGPFALLAFFLLVGVAYTVTEVKKASGATLVAFRRILVGEVVFVLALSVFAMFVWYKSNVDAPHIITGSIEGLRDELVVSDDLFLRPKLTTYEWKLITKRQLKDGETVDVVIATPQSVGLLPPHHNIKIKSEFYNADALVKLVWRREEGRVFYLDNNEPLPVTGAHTNPASVHLASPSWLPRLPSVFAQSMGKFSNDSVQIGAGSANPVVREEAIRQLARNGVGSVDSIRKLLQSPNPATIAGGIIALNLMDDKAKQQIREKQMLADSSNAIVRAMGADSESLRNEALRCISWYDSSQIAPIAAKLLASGSTDQRLLGLRILDKYGRQESIAILQRCRKIEKDSSLQREMDKTISTLKNLGQIAQQRSSPSPTTTGKRKELIDLAFQFQKKGLGFKWGGKTEAEGFDSSGFAAYLLSRVGVIKEPEKYWSGLLRQGFPETKTPEVGDLVFYDLGYVTFYLGSDSCIGMTPSGITVQPVDFGPRRLSYGHVPY